MVGQSLDAIVSIGIAEMCICTSCSTYCTRFCSNSTISKATETWAVGTARGAAAHFRDTNRKYTIRRSSHQSFKSNYIGSGICSRLKLVYVWNRTFLIGTSKSADFQPTTWSKIRFSHFLLAFSCSQILFRAHNSLSNTQTHRFDISCARPEFSKWNTRFSRKISLLPMAWAVLVNFSPLKGRKSVFLSFCCQFLARRYILWLVTHFRTRTHVCLISDALCQGFRSEIWIFMGNIFLPRARAISGDLRPRHGRKSGFILFCWRFPARSYFSGLITHFQTHKHIGSTSVALDQIFRSEIRDFQGKYHFCIQNRWVLTIFGDFSPENGQKSRFLTFCWRFPARRYILGLITHFQTHKHIGLTSVALDQIFRSEIRDFHGK